MADIDYAKELRKHRALRSCCQPGHETQCDMCAALEAGAEALEAIDKAAVLTHTYSASHTAEAALDAIIDWHVDVVRELPVPEEMRRFLELPFVAENKKLHEELVDTRRMFAAAVLCAGGELRVSEEALGSLDRDTVLNRWDDPRTRSIVLSVGAKK